jgi:CheY-like chemotaxis protein
MLSTNGTGTEKAQESAGMAEMSGGMAPALPGEREGQGNAIEAGFVLSNGLTVGMGIVPSAMVLQVLVVDGDEALRKACGDVASAMGCAVIYAESIAAAQAILKFQKVDLLLLDLRLPGGGGLALLEGVKTQFPDTGVVVMTAFRDADRGGGLSDQAV